MTCPRCGNTTFARNIMQVQVNTGAFWQCERCLLDLNEDGTENEVLIPPPWPVSIPSTVISMDSYLREKHPQHPPGTTHTGDGQPQVLRTILDNCPATGLSIDYRVCTCGGKQHRGFFGLVSFGGEDDPCPFYCGQERIGDVVCQYRDPDGVVSGGQRD